MTPDRAWVRLGSGKRLDLISSQPDQWEDRDLAVGLSRTYRWGGHSRWALPLTVAQHSLLVLVLRQQLQPHQLLSPREALREVLFDAEEALLNCFAPVPTLRPHLGGDFIEIARQLRTVVSARYALPDWQGYDYALHLKAENLTTASEACHVAGWDLPAMRHTLGIQLAPLQDDPLPLLGGLQPWEPWPAKLAAALFLAKLRELDGAVHLAAALFLAKLRELDGAVHLAAALFLAKLRELDGAVHLAAAADLTTAVQREATLARLAETFSRLPLRTRMRCKHPPIGSSLGDTFVFVEADDISQQHLEGVIVDGERDEDGEWVLDGEFTVFTTDEELACVLGWNCTAEIQLTGESLTDASGRESGVRTGQGD